MFFWTGCNPEKDRKETLQNQYDVVSDSVSYYYNDMLSFGLAVGIDSNDLHLQNLLNDVREMDMNDFVAKYQMDDYMLKRELNRMERVYQTMSSIEHNSKLIHSYNPIIEDDSVKHTLKELADELPDNLPDIQFDDKNRAYTIGDNGDTMFIETEIES